MCGAALAGIYNLFYPMAGRRREAAAQRAAELGAELFDPQCDELRVELCGGGAGPGAELCGEVAGPEAAGPGAELPAPRTQQPRPQLFVNAAPVSYGILGSDHLMSGHFT